MALLYPAGTVFVDGSFLPLAGGKIHTYESGTTTDQATYSDKALSTANANPIVLDGSGRLTLPVYVPDGTLYTIDRRTSSGSSVGSADEVFGWSSRGVSEAANVAAMTALVLEDGSIVQTLGYTTAGDGGHGTYRYDADATDTANGGSILGSGTGRFFLLRDAALNVKQFGAAGDGTTDDTAAIQAAIDTIEANTTARGPLLFPKGDYLISAPLTVTASGITLEGEGAGDFTTPVGAASGSALEAATRIVGSHTTGAMIRVSAINGTVIKGIKLDATAARAAAATGYGLHFEAVDDGSNNLCAYNRIEDVRVISQPSDGLIFVGGITGTYLERVSSDKNGGHGFCFDRGVRTGRTNLHSPGIATLMNCRATENAGHALACGNPADTTLPSYRIHAVNLETFENCTDAAVYYENYQVYFHCDNGVLDTCAFGGTSQAGVIESHGGLWISGRSATARNCRYIETNQPVEVGYVDAGAPARGVFIDGMEIRNTTLTHAVAVLVSSTSITGVRVRIDNTQAYTAAVTANRDATEMDTPNDHLMKGHLNVGSLSAGTGRTINDDAADSFLFDTETKGVAVISGNNSTSGAAVVHFRTHTSEHCSLVSSQGNVAVTTGVLSGTTGTDGDLTISAHTDGRLYIENRTGAQRAYFVQFLAVQGGPLNEAS